MLNSIDEYTHQLSVRTKETDTGRYELTLTINRIGLTLHKLLFRKINGDVDERDVLAGPESSLAFKTEGRKFMNQVVGRYTNRLPAGHLVPLFDLNLSETGRSGVTLDLENNEPSKKDPSKGNCLHSGKEGYDLREFKRVTKESNIVKEFKLKEEEDKSLSQEEATTEGEKECAYYHLFSHSGDQGFPESIDILATITLEISSEIDSKKDINHQLNRIGRARFDLKAKISNSNHPIEVKKDDSKIDYRGTPINLTWHNGYILNNFKTLNPDEPGIYQHKLWINTVDYLEIDDDQLPTGQIKSLDSLGFTFGPPLSSSASSSSDIKPIKEIMPSSGFDHCFLFKRSNNKDKKKKNEDETNCKVILKSPKEELMLKMYTNQDSVQCYSGNYLDGLGTRKNLHQNYSFSSSTNKSGYNKHDSIYLEFQQPTSLCTNLNLQQNFKKFINNSHIIQQENDEDKDVYEKDVNINSDLVFSNFTSILYPNQIYNNWFFIDFFC